MTRPPRVKFAPTVAGSEAEVAAITVATVAMRTARRARARARFKRSPPARSGFEVTVEVDPENPRITEHGRNEGHEPERGRDQEAHDGPPRQYQDEAQEEDEDDADGD